MLETDALPVLPGSQSLVLFKYFGEVAAFSEAGIQAYSSDRKRRAVQQVGCLLDTEEIHIVHGGLVCDGSEDPAEVFWIHTGNGGQLLQSQIFPVMVLDEFQYGFYLLHAVIGGKILVFCRGI